MPLGEDMEWLAEHRVEQRTAQNILDGWRYCHPEGLLSRRRISSGIWGVFRKSTSCFTSCRQERCMKIFSHHLFHGMPVLECTLSCTQHHSELQSHPYINNLLPPLTPGASLSQFQSATNASMIMMGSQEQKYERNANFINTAHTALSYCAAAQHAPQGQLHLQSTAHTVDTSPSLRAQSAHVHRCL